MSDAIDSPRPSSADAARARARSALAVVLVVLGAALAWGVLAMPDDPRPSYDDREAVVGNPVVEGSLPARAAFERDYWHHWEDAGHYRPLATLLLRFDHARALRSDGSLDWRVFRRTNVALHVLVVTLAGLVLLRLERVRSLALPWFGLGLFALHPAGADVVAWISGRTSLVSGLGAAVGALIATFATRRRTVALLAGFLGTGIALLGKEDGVVLVVAMPVVAAACGGRRAATWTFLAALAATAGVAALRGLALGDPVPSATGAPLASEPLMARVGIGLAAWWSGFVSLVTPWVARPPATFVGDVAALPGAALLVALFAALALGFRGRPGGGASLAGLGLVAVSIAPLAQIVPAGELFAPRFLYQPLLLGVFATSGAADLVLAKLPAAARNAAKVAALAGCVALVPGAAATYRDRASFWEAHLPAHGNDARVWSALGYVAREAGDPDLARERYERAASLDPGYSRPCTRLGTLAMESGDLDEAERWLREAVARGPSNPVAQANLGNLLLRRERPGEAVAAYRRAVELSPGHAAMHRGLARALLRQGDHIEAAEAVRRALVLDPTDEAAARLQRTIETGRTVER